MILSPAQAGQTEFGLQPFQNPTRVGRRATRFSRKHFSRIENAISNLRVPSASARAPDVLGHAITEIASGSKLGIDATEKVPGEGFKRPWPSLIKMDAAVKTKVENLFNP